MAPLIGACVLCGKPSIHSCHHTKPDGSLSPTIYCSKECQKKDWPKHKDECQKSRARARMYQAAELLHELVLEYCARTNEFAIADVQRFPNGTVHVYEGKPGADPFRGINLDRFPHLSDTQKKAVISFSHGKTTALTALQWLARLLLHDCTLYTTLEQSWLKIKESQVTIFRHSFKTCDTTGAPTSYYEADPIPVTHTVFICIPNYNEAYYIDPFGDWLHPSGGHRIVWDMDEYNKEMLAPMHPSCHKGVSPFLCDISLRKDQDISSINPVLPGLGAGTNRLRDKVVGTIVKALQADVPAKEMLKAVKLPREAFLVEKDRLVGVFRRLVASQFDGAADVFVKPDLPAIVANDMKDAIRRGKDACGLDPQRGDFEQSEAQVLLELFMKCGPDQKLYEMVKEMRGSSVKDDAAFAEIGHRCAKLEDEEMWFEAILFNLNATLEMAAARQQAGLDPYGPR